VPQAVAAYYQGSYIKTDSKVASFTFENFTSTGHEGDRKLAMNTFAREDKEAELARQSFKNITLASKFTVYLPH
jgi:hypothetical protein